MGLSQNDGDPDDSNIAKNEGDSDSELDNFGNYRKKGGRAKFNRVSPRVHSIAPLFLTTISHTHF